MLFRRFEARNSQVSEVAPRVSMFQTDEYWQRLGFSARWQCYTARSPDRPLMDSSFSAPPPSELNTFLHIHPISFLYMLAYPHTTCSVVRQTLFFELGTKEKFRNASSALAPTRTHTQIERVPSLHSSAVTILTSKHRFHEWHSLHGALPWYIDCHYAPFEDRTN